MFARSISGSYGSRATEAMNSAIGKMKGQMGDAVDRIDSTRRPVAHRLHGAAEALTGVAEGAAGRLHASARYIRSHDTRDMMHDLVGAVRRHPTRSLLIAGALGFLVARALRRRRH